VIGVDAAETATAAALSELDLLLFVLPADRDRGLQIVRTLRQLTARRIVTMGPADDPKRILDVLHAGADDYLDETADPVEQLSQEVQRYLAAAGGANQGGALIAVTAAVGGAGCTFVAANLAVLLAQRSESCGLLEVIGGYGDLAETLNVEPRHSLADLCRNIDVLDQNMLKQSFSTHASGVQLIAAPPEHSDHEDISPQAADRVVRMSRTVQPWTIVDVDQKTMRQTTLANDSGLLVVLTRPDLSSLCRTKRLLRDLTEKGVDRQRILLVSNRCGNRSEIPHAKVAPVLGQDVAVWLPDDPSSVLVSINCGNPLVLECPRSALSRSLGKIADIVVQRFPDAGVGAMPSVSHPTNGVVRRAAGILF
jgi:pilus assembly protein CpaE